MREVFEIVVDFQILIHCRESLSLGRLVLNCVLARLLFFLDLGMIFNNILFIKIVLGGHLNFNLVCFLAMKLFTFYFEKIYRF